MTLFVALILLGLQLTGYRTGCVMRHITKAALVVSLYLCIYAYLHCLLLKGHVLTGPFENPNVLALHLCLLLPFVHDESIVNKRRLVLRLMNISAEVLCIITVLFTECRAAFLCIFFFYSFTLLKGRWKLTVIPLLLSAGLLSALFVKKPSSQGRMFIIQNTMKLISKAPVLGHGMRGFDLTYMPQQAEYFRTHDNTEVEMLADDIRHPLNEFLLAGVNYGIVGIAVLAIVLTLPLVWRRRLFNGYRSLWTSLSMLVVFCMFGYPLLYPLPWLLIVGCWFTTFMEIIVRWIGSFRNILLACSIGTLILSVGYTYVLLQWGCASRMAKRGRSAEVLEQYERLYPYLSWRGMFLYDYAIESFYADRNEQALRLTEECRKLDISYDLILLEGDINRYLQRHDNALLCYDEAMCMCPVRFAPLYGKWKVYKKTNNIERMDSVSRMILSKRIKVDSPEVQMILTEIKETNACVK